MRQKQEIKVLIIGGILILAVFLVTFLRPRLNSNKETDTSLEENSIIYNEISVTELKEKIRNKENILIADIRSSDLYEVEHIVDSKNIDWQNLSAYNFDFGQYDLIVIVNDGSRNTNFLAIQAFQKQGVSNLAVLSGGYSPWKESGTSTISWGDPTSFSEQAKVSFIDSTELVKKLSESYPIFLLDIRPSAQHSQNHISGSVNIPLEQIESERNNLPFHKEIVVYGENDLDGFQAGVKLYDLNFFAVKVLRGGFMEWKNSQKQ